MNIDQRIMIKELMNEFCEKSIYSYGYSVYGVLDAEIASTLASTSEHEVERKDGLILIWRIENGKRGYLIPHRVLIKNRGNSYTILGK